MEVIKTRIEIGNADEMYDLYVDDVIQDTDLTLEELDFELDQIESEDALCIRLAETRETDNGVDYYWNLIVDGFPMYVGIPREFADAITDALTYRR